MLAYITVNMVSGKTKNRETTRKRQTDRQTDRDTERDRENLGNIRQDTFLDLSCTNKYQRLLGTILRWISVLSRGSYRLSSANTTETRDRHRPYEA